MLPIVPKRSPLVFLRLGGLLVVLCAVIAFSQALTRFDPGSVFIQAILRVMGQKSFDKFTASSAPYPSEVSRNPTLYSRAMAEELKIGVSSRDFFLKYGFVPSSVDQLARIGLDPSYYRDPWSRPYRTYLLPAGIIIVQSTGPSGVNRLSQEWLASAKDRMHTPVQLVGDNLVILEAVEER